MQLDITTKEKSETVHKFSLTGTQQSELILNALADELGLDDAAIAAATVLVETPHVPPAPPASPPWGVTVGPSPLVFINVTVTIDELKADSMRPSVEQITDGAK